MRRRCGQGLSGRSGCSGRGARSGALALALMLVASPALADRVAPLPSRGGLGLEARARLDRALSLALGAEGHTLAEARDVDAAVARVVPDGLADAPDEHRRVAVATKADWVVVAEASPRKGGGVHVELTAFLERRGRLETVARELPAEPTQAELAEMLRVLVREAGVGTDMLPWETGVAVAVKPPPETPVAGQPVARPVAGPLGPHEAWPTPSSWGRWVKLDYAFHSHKVWPPYGGTRRGFLDASLGFSVPVARPGPARQTGAAQTATLRGGATVGDFGLELFADVGGHLAGPAVFFADVGARLMTTPSVSRGDEYGTAFHVGPSIFVGPFVRLPSTVTGADGQAVTTPAEASFSAGLSLDLSLYATPWFALEAHLGNARVVVVPDGALLLVGASLGATVRL
jgi:hypothetical protein